jgi:transposase-like protein
VIIDDWALSLLTFIPQSFSNTRFQGCNWHAIKAILKFYRGKKKDYITEEINGSGEEL